MIYLDYSATTPVNPNVLSVFENVTKNFIGNANSLHELGINSSQLIDESTKIISDFFHVGKDEIIYTSGATESNNLALWGVARSYVKRSKRIITTHLEHSSVLEPLKRLEEQGFEIAFVNLKSDGTVDLDHLKKLLDEGALLVTICAVDSEMGIKQPIKEIARLITKYKTTIFHSDITQALGKTEVDLTNVDLASFSSHKIYGLKGIGGLIKKSNISLEPIIYGGKSTTIYRAGTPPTSLIASLAKAIKLITINDESIKEFNQQIRKKLLTYSNVLINSTTESIPQILNFSIMGSKPETVIHMFEKERIYLSSKTACSSKHSISASINYLYRDEERAASSIRISISHITTKGEIVKFLETLDSVYQQLLLKN